MRGRLVVVIKVKRLSAESPRLLDPSAPEWRSLPEETLVLQPTPLLSQPSLYIQAKWKDVPYGVTTSVNVKALHNGAAIFFHLRWADETNNDSITDTDTFADAAAVLFPVKGDAPLTSMGSPDQPVNGWLWRPDLETMLSVTVQGVGTAVRNADSSLAAQNAYSDGGWNVVVSRALQSESPNAVQLKPGDQGKVAFAVWQGANNERGGLKAVTLEWQPLEIEN